MAIGFCQYFAIVLKWLFWLFDAKSRANYDYRQLVYVILVTYHFQVTINKRPIDKL